ncbi:uncharacterized protein LOC128982465 [Macrosteles quadrilineatus]|uniref:uncharacterized protein LOC128982465 n=1 Tax=Macrosteles quadrilineatus TaxID=74068 RepID=UPI0023E27B75|nr:uncharacterized protein LOC128982465 [Macrosteles quadrilineatus]
MSLEDLQTQLAELRTANEELRQRIGQPSTSQNMSVNRVAVKLPPFWPERPSLWFCQVDSQFLISGITNDDTKFHYVVSQLDTGIAAEVEDIITNPPQGDKYGHLKKKLIERLSASEEQRVRRLLSEEDLGDRKPSQFLRHLRSLAGSTPLQDNMLRQLWLRRLPPHSQAILTTQLELSLDKLAELADKIMEVADIPSTPGICEVSSGNASLLNAIESLSKQVQALSETRVRDTQVRPRGRSQSRGGSGNEPNPSKNWCWYHRKFKNNATKCLSPCSFQGNLSNNP